jgi:tRNA pseudouridine55 synthase
VTPADGIILIDKPVGPTSQQVVTRVKRALGARRAGHAGTLDPGASGLLVVGLNRATRLLGYLTGHDKTYTATIRLGHATTTDDADGAPVGAVVDATRVADQAIAQGLARLAGTIDQVPSAVSAVKVDGRRAYQMVRAGLAVDLAPRRVTVHRLELLRRLDNAPWVDLSLVVDCSPGTYIRALARDLGRHLGVGAHLTALRRTRSGALAVADAVSPDAAALADVIDLAQAVGLVGPKVTVDEATAGRVRAGAPIAVRVVEDPTAIMFQDQVLALYKPDPRLVGWARAVAVFPEAPVEPGEELA